MLFRSTLGRALASMTRSPFVPLTLKSGSRTPHRAPRSDIAAVPTPCSPLHSTNHIRIPETEPIQDSTYVEVRFLAYWMNSSSVLAEVGCSHAPMTNPSQALAVMNRWAALRAATIVLMSKSVVKKLGLMMGGSNGSALLNLTSPPVRKVNEGLDKRRTA